MFSQLRLSCYCFWFIEPRVQTRRELTRTAFSTDYKPGSVEGSQIPYRVSLEGFGKQQGQWEVVLDHKMTTNEKMYHDPLKTGEWRRAATAQPSMPCKNLSLLDSGNCRITVTAPQVHHVPQWPAPTGGSHVLPLPPQHTGQVTPTSM